MASTQTSFNDAALIIMRYKRTNWHFLLIEHVSEPKWILNLSGGMFKITYRMIKDLENNNSWDLFCTQKVH